MNRDPLWVRIVMKGDIKKLDNYIKSAIAKIRSGGFYQSIMSQIGNEAYHQTTRY